VIPAQAERLTRAFYEWELRGRGWELCPYPTRLEPPFRPFRWLSSPPAVADDGRRHTWLSGLLERLAIRSDAVQAEEPEEDEEAAAPDRCDEAPELREFLLVVPKEARPTRAALLGWLQSFASVSERASFEIWGSGERIECCLALPSREASHVAGQLRAALPEIVATEVGETLNARFAATGGSRFAGVELGLASEFMVPLALPRPGEEALLAVIAALADLGDGELAVFQVLFEACREPWPESMLRAVMTPSGEPFFADAPEISAFAREKVATSIFAVALRVGALAGSAARARELLARIAGGLARFGSPLRNELLPLPQAEPSNLQEDLLARTTHRPGMLLSADELSALIQLPGPGVEVVKLWRGEGRTRGAPAETLGEGSCLGVNIHGGRRAEVRLAADTRLKHVHLIGAPGTGKSTLLISMILADIEAGYGVGVIDPHGDLADEVASRLPIERTGDCVLFDPADEETTVGWNILGADSDPERELLASDLVAAFRRLSTSWGDQMTAVLGNAIQVFLESPRGGTLLDLRRFLVDAAFRKEMLATVSDPYVASFWEIEFPRLIGRRPETPILTRLDMFLRSRLVRRVVTTAEPRLDFRKLTNEGGVFLGKLAQGAIGEENAALLGSLLVSKFHQVTLARAADAPESRRPFFLYIDEFHAVATASMASLFSGARKYRLGVTVAHQDLSQLHRTMPELERSILGNAYTRICFRVGEEDARQLAKGLSTFSAEDLMSLAVGEAVARVGGRDGDFNLKTAPLEPLSKDEAFDRQSAVRAATRARFAARLRPPEGPDPGPDEEPSIRRGGDRDAAVEPAVRGAPEAKAPPQAAPEPPREPALDKAVLDYLALVARSPFLAVRERNAALGLSAWRGDRLKDAILASGLAEEVAVNPGGRGERFKLLDLTDQGRELIVRYGIPLATGRGRGGIAHQWWARTIADWLNSQDAETAVEDVSKGARVDVLAKTSGHEVAVEIELREGHALVNIRKDLAAGFDRVVCLFDSPETLERVRAKLDLVPDRVVLGDLRDYEGVLASVFSSLRGPNQNTEPRARRRAPGGSGPPAVTLPAPPPLFEPGAFSTPLAADYLGLSPATLETLRTRGGGPPFSKLGRRVVYAREDLDAWLVERKRASTADRGE
jgi:hypothetical protein